MIRLSSTGSSLGLAEVSTTEPPVRPSIQGPVASRGASARAIRVKRVPPETSWNGIASACWALLQSTVISVRSIARCASGFDGSLREPFTIMKWPLAISGIPSGATSARSVAEIEPSASKLLQSIRSASSKSRSDRLRASKLTARTPLPIGMMFACTSQGREASSEPSPNSSSPERGRVRLRWMFSNFDWWPLRTSSTTRLPLLRPISVRSPPSRPSAPRLSSQARKLAKPSCRLRLSPLRESGGAGVAVDGPTDASDAVVVSGRRAAPVDTDTRPSASTRIASSAPTRLRRSARGVPLNRLALESPTSAFGALAISAPSRSRTLMSRMRMAARPCSSRSSTVPPTSI